MTQDKPPPSETSKRAVVRRRPGKARAERSEETRRKLFDATVATVGRMGYQDASVSRITARARVAQGTFYNYFETQQDLFDQLLPTLGGDLLARIRERIRALPAGATALEREEAGLRTFFDYLIDVPEFYRILNEAETFAPAGHRRHVDNMVGGYLRALARARGEGAITRYEGRELEAVATMLVAIRHYLAMRYTFSEGNVNHLPEWVAETYMKFLSHGLFEPAAEPAGGSARARNARSAAAHGPTIASELRGRTLASDPDVAVVALEAGRRHLSEDGSVSRAVLAALVEQAGAIAADPERAGSYGLVDLALTCVRPAQEGTLIASARHAYDTGGLRFVHVEVTGESRKGLLLATARLTFEQRFRT